MVRLESGSWNDLGRSAERLRVDVFVREQGVPPEIERPGSHLDRRSPGIPLLYE